MDTTILIAGIGVVVAVLTYFAGVKRSSNAETEQEIIEQEDAYRAEQDKMNQINDEQELSDDIPF